MTVKGTVPPKFSVLVEVLGTVSQRESIPPSASRMEARSRRALQTQKKCLEEAADNLPPHSDVNSVFLAETPAVASEPGAGFPLTCELACCGRDT